MTNLLQYDLIFQVTKTVKGQGLAKMLVDEPENVNMLGRVEGDSVEGSSSIEHSPWYFNIWHYLVTLDCPENFTLAQKRSLKQQCEKYVIVQDKLYWRHPQGVLLQCIQESEFISMLEEYHANFYGVHYAGRATTNKIIQVGFYWLSLSTTTYQHVKCCHQCHIFTSNKKLSTMPLNPVVSDFHFAQWGLDLIGEIKSPSSAGHRWIVTATDYFSKWVEAEPLKVFSTAMIIMFLENNILTRFGVPAKLVTDNGSYFTSIEMIDFCVKYHIELLHSSNYYPQCNGLAESTNKNLLTRSRRMLGNN